MSYSYLNFSNYKNRLKQTQPFHVFHIKNNENINKNNNNCTNKNHYIQEKLIQFEMQRPLESGESCPFNNSRYGDNTSNLYKSKEYALNFDDSNNNNNNNDENVVNFNLFKIDSFDRTVSFLSGKYFLFYLSVYF
jgi:hypothetical protein